MGKKKGASASSDPKDYPDTSLVIVVDSLLRVPSMDVGKPSDPFVKIIVGAGDNAEVWETKIKESISDPTYDEVFDLGPQTDPKKPIKFEVYDWDRFSANDFIGVVEMTIGDILERPASRLLLSKSDGNMVVKKSRNSPTELRIRILKAPDAFPPPAVHNLAAYPKHIMMFTRGTQGDVQPFVALARGLAEREGYLVTIVTELRFKDFVKKNADVSRGYIRFRPSGGDTTTRIDGAVAKWAMQAKSEFMQAAMLARSEREFFESEPVLFYWADQLQPQAIIYGFTMANIALIVGEALHIPVLGFVLQPTCIPSSRYEAVVAIDTHAMGLLDNLEKKVVGHDSLSKMKQAMENNPFDITLNEMRTKRGLRPFRGSAAQTWPLILEKNLPVIVPINEVTFGGKPPDWPEHCRLTDFIFLRRGAKDELPKDMMAFINNSKAGNRPLIVMGFSSMPIDRQPILQIALSIIHDAVSKPDVIALVGNKLDQPLKSKFQAEVDEAKAQGRLFETKGAPFGELFKYMDCIVVHGGLGTTAEALRAGVPTIVTGVLLMDQRFWGKQCNDLGVGPPPRHISDFEKTAAQTIDHALAPDSDWRSAAAQLAPRIQGESADGVEENVRAVVELLDQATTFEM